MDTFRAYHIFASKLGAQTIVTKSVVDYTLNYLINRRLGKLNEVKRNTLFGKDKKMLLSEADLIVTSVLLWFYSSFQKTPMRGLLCKEYKVEFKTNETDLKSLIKRIDATISDNDILVMEESIKYTDFLFNYNHKFKLSDQLSDQEHIVTSVAYVALCLLSSNANIQNLLKNKVYRIAFLKEVIGISVDVICPMDQGYFYSTLHNASNYLAGICLTINYTDQEADEEDNNTVACSSVEAIEEPVIRKRMSPSYEGDQSEEDKVIEDDNEDHNYSSYLTQKLSRKDGSRFDVTQPKRGEADPFKQIGRAWDSFNNSNVEEIPAYKVGMKVSALPPKKPIKKPIVKHRSVSGTPEMSYAEMKRKQREMNKLSLNSEVSKTNSDEDIYSFIPKSVYDDIPLSVNKRMPKKVNIESSDEESMNNVNKRTTKKVNIESSDEELESVDNSSKDSSQECLDVQEDIITLVEADNDIQEDNITLVDEDLVSSNGYCCQHLTKRNDEGGNDIFMRLRNFIN